MSKPTTKDHHIPEERTQINTHKEAEINARFMRGFDAMQRDVHETAREKGWWDDGDRNEGEMIALMHSELSEALEGLRAGNPPDDKVPQCSSVEAELADVIIRIMDYAEAFGHDVAYALCVKAQYNKGRKHKHGGKKF